MMKTVEDRIKSYEALYNQSGGSMNLHVFIRHLAESDQYQSEQNSNTRQALEDAIALRREVDRHNEKITKSLRKLIVLAELQSYDCGTCQRIEGYTNDEKLIKCKLCKMNQTIILEAKGLLPK